MSAFSEGLVQIKLQVYSQQKLKIFSANSAAGPIDHFYIIAHMVSEASSSAWLYILRFPLAIYCGHFAQTKRFRWELIIMPAFCSHCLSFYWPYLLCQIKRDWIRAWWHHIFVSICSNKVCFATRSCLVWPLLISLQPSPERVTTCFPFHPRLKIPSTSPLSAIFMTRMKT